MLPINSPAATGAAALSGAMIGPVLVWLFSCLHLTPPPPDVAPVLGALLIMFGHFVSTRLIPIRDGSRAAADLSAPAVTGGVPPVPVVVAPVVTPGPARPLFDPAAPGKPFEGSAIFQRPIIPTVNQASTT